jgi:hypothetical protein
MPGTDRVIAGSKIGQFYLLNRNNLGRIQAGNGQIPQSFLGTSGCAAVLTFQVCAQVMGQALAYQSSPPVLYVWGVRDRPKAYAWQQNGFNPVAISTGSYAVQYPGGVLAHSAYKNVSSTGLLWALTSDVPDQDFFFGPGFNLTFAVRAVETS